MEKFDSTHGQNPTKVRKCFAKFLHHIKSLNLRYFRKGSLKGSSNCSLLNNLFYHSLSLSSPILIKVSYPDFPTTYTRVVKRNFIKKSIHCIFNTDIRYFIYCNRIQNLCSTAQ